MSRALSEDKTEWDEDDIKYAMDRGMFESVDEANDLLEDVGSDFRYGEDTSVPNERLGQFAGSDQPAEVEDDLNGLLKDDLIGVAEEEGVEYLSSDTKAEITDKIRAARSAQG